MKFSWFASKFHGFHEIRGNPQNITFWDPFWHTLDKTGIIWTWKVGIFGYMGQKGVKKGVQNDPFWGSCGNPKIIDFGVTFGGGGQNGGPQKWPIFGPFLSTFWQVRDRNETKVSVRTHINMRARQNREKGGQKGCPKMTPFLDPPPKSEF